MKKLLLLLFCLSPFLSYCQEESFTYSFSLEGIEEPSDAKYVSEALFELFDTTPAFDDKKDEFTVTSLVVLDQSKFQSKVELRGYSLSDFSKLRTLKEGK